MTAKELRYALNARLAGRRGPGTCVSLRSVERWVRRWVVAGLVEEVEVRQPGQKGGRPAVGFKVKAPIYEGRGVANLPSFFGNPSGAAAEGLRQVCDKTTPESEMSQTSEAETPRSQRVACETNATELSVENFVEKPAVEGPEVCDSFRHEEGLSQTSELETPSSTGVSENGSEVCDTASEIYGTSVSTQDYGDWDDTGWGASPDNR